MPNAASGAAPTAGALAIIPARAGSKGLPGKNLLEVGGRTLVGHAAAVAREVAGIDTVVVSTDGEDIAEEAARWGAKVHWRPEGLAGDEALVIDAVRHLLAERAAAGTSRPYGVLLEPTTPLRTAQDVEQCLEAVRAGSDSAATFTEAAVHPHRAFVIEGGKPSPFIPGAVPWKPRQALQPPAYQLSGACYAFRCDSFPAEGPSLLFGEAAAVIVPRSRSLDVDDEVDLAVIDTLLQSRATP